MKYRKIFITGATGFIGKHLALELAKDNQVTVLVRGPRTDNKDKELLSYGIRVVWGDLLNNKTYAAEINEADYVFHLAALFKIDAPKDESYKMNVLGTTALLEVCNNAKLKRFVFFSTAYVSAGRKERDGIKEDEPYAREPRNWYEWSKAEAEKSAIKYCKENNIPLTVIRPATVYGPGNLYGWYLIFKAIKDKKVFLSSGGCNKIHFVYVYDVIRAALHLAQVRDAAGKIYNICDEHPYSQKEAVTAISKAMGINSPLISIPRGLFRWALGIKYFSGLFYNSTPEMLDFYTNNHTFSNLRLKNTGFKFLFPDFKDGLEETISHAN